MLKVMITRMVWRYLTAKLKPAAAPAQRVEDVASAVCRPIGAVARKVEAVAPLAAALRAILKKGKG